MAAASPPPKASPVRGQIIPPPRDPPPRPPRSARSPTPRIPPPTTTSIGHARRHRHPRRRNVLRVPTTTTPIRCHRLATRTRTRTRTNAKDRHRGPRPIPPLVPARSPPASPLAAENMNHQPCPASASSVAGRRLTATARPRAAAATEAAAVRTDTAAVKMTSSVTVIDDLVGRAVRLTTSWTGNLRMAVPAQPVCSQPPCVRLA